MGRRSVRFTVEWRPLGASRGARCEMWRGEGLCLFRGRRIGLREVRRFTLKRFALFLLTLRLRGDIEADPEEVELFDLDLREASSPPNRFK